jgi:hypothetical protein
MGNGMSLGLKQAFYGIAGIFQMGCYIAFLTSPAENMLIGGFRYGFIFFIFVAFLLSILASNIPTSDCGGTGCDNLYNQIIMSICSVLTTVLVIMLLMNDFLENNRIAFAAAAFGLVLLSMFWTLYAFDFRGLICMCDEGSSVPTEASCRAALPECTISCI